MVTLMKCFCGSTLVWFYVGQILHCFELEAFLLLNIWLMAVIIVTIATMDAVVTITTMGAVVHGICADSAGVPVQHQHQHHHHQAPGHFLQLE